MIKHYDVIIIGGGIAGLYSAYNIQKLSPSTSFLVLEKYKKKWLGGRMNNELFFNTVIPTGAGVIRKKKDKLLMNLIHELKISTSESYFDPQYASTFQNIDIKKVMKLLRNRYEQHEHLSKTPMTFRQFAEPLLGSSNYKKFITSVGYTDYENEDVFETLYHYGMEDNACCWEIANVNWKHLVSKLCNSIGMKNIKTSSNVVKIEKISGSPCEFVIETKKEVSYSCNKVIVATTIDTLRKLIPGASNPNSIYQQIEGQPFLRLYGKFSKNSIPIIQSYVPEYMIVPGPIQKIIPINPENGVYMISYSDNKNATFFKDRLENTPENREYYCRLIEKSLGIPEGSLHLNAISDYYWPIGTHYYKPLKKNIYDSREEFIDKAQHPEEGMLVVGEVVSRNQGWSEGALESVKNVLTKKWLTRSNC
jgi:hypothetical protein